MRNPVYGILSLLWSKVPFGENCEIKLLAAEAGPHLASIRGIKPQHSRLAAPGKALEELFKADLIKTNTPTTTPISCPLLKTNNNTALFAKHRGIFCFKYFFLFHIGSTC